MQTKILILLLLLLVSCNNHKKSEKQVATKPAYISKDIKANVNADSVLAILKDEKFFSDTNQFKYWTPEEAKAYAEFTYAKGSMKRHMAAFTNYLRGAGAVKRNMVYFLIHNKVIQLLRIEDIVPATNNYRQFTMNMFT